jgi:PAS domain S-box-containing protein
MKRKGASKRCGRVLVVDDSRVVRTVVAEGLRRAGHEVDEAPDGSAAVELLDRDCYDVVMTDLHMPGLDGFGLLDSVKRGDSGTEVIILTGTHAQDITAALRALRSGAHDFLTKPLQGADQAVLSVERAIEKKRHREALREAEARYHQLFDRVPIGLYRTSPDGRFLDVNPALVQMLGAASREALLAGNVKAFHIDDEERRRFERELDATGIGHCEKRLRRPDGLVLWVEDDARVIRDPLGAIVCYEGSLRDITERKLAEEALAIKTEQLQTITEATMSFLARGDLGEASAPLLRLALRQTGSPQGFIGVVHDGPVLRIVAQRGLAWGSNRGRDITTEDLPEIRSLRNLFGQVVTNGGRAVCVSRPAASELDGLPEGLPQLEQFLAVPIRSGSEVVGMIGVVNRPTPYSGSEQASLEVLTNATGVIYHSYRRVLREAALEAQLRQSQKMEAIGRLAGGVAHDFNNLLTAISGYGELIAQELPSAGVGRTYAAALLKAAESAAALVRQLLAFSRRQVLQPTRLDLNVIVTDMRDMLRRLIGEDIALDVELDRSLGQVQADRSQIEQVLMNLVVNARDAMPEGGRLQIQTANVNLDDNYVRGHVGAKGGAHVMLRVADSGQGMDAETLSRIFEPFFTTKTGSTKGTGLGLATVYGIVKQADGYIWVDSTLGHGATFTVYLPRIDAVTVAAAPARTTTPSAQGGTEVVLLVEDDDLVRELACQHLARRGYTVLRARNGQEALGVVEGRLDEIAVLVSDVVMPGMTGYQLAQQLRRQRPDIPTLFMSGYSAANPDADSGGSTRSSFLAKPFSLEALAAKVRELIDAA